MQPGAAVRWITAAVLTAVACPGAAAVEPRLERGTQELSIHLSPDFEGAIGDTIDARAGWGVFVRDRLSLRGVLTYQILEDVAGEDSDYRTSQLGLAAEFHFAGLGRAVPYVGAGAGWRRTAFDRIDEAALVYGPRAGIKLYLADDVALDFEVTYELSSADVFVNDFVAEDRDLSSLVGLRVSF